MERNLFPGDGTDDNSWHTCDPTIMTVDQLALMNSYWKLSAHTYVCGTPGDSNLSKNDPTAPDFESEILNELETEDNKENEELINESEENFVGGSSLLSDDSLENQEAEEVIDIDKEASSEEGEENEQLINEESTNLENGDDELGSEQEADEENEKTEETEKSINEEQSETNEKNGDEQESSEENDEPTIQEPNQENSEPPATVEESSLSESSEGSSDLSGDGSSNDSNNSNI
jgi:hypothetical protein